MTEKLLALFNLKLDYLESEGPEALEDEYQNLIGYLSFKLSEDNLNKLQEEKTQLLSVVKIQEDQLKIYKSKLEAIEKQRSRKHLSTQEEPKVKFKSLIPKTPKKTSKKKK